jgi:hypothetical protein
MIGNTLSVPSSGDPLAALIETELRPLARVLARLIACGIATAVDPADQFAPAQR